MSSIRQSVVTWSGFTDKLLGGDARRWGLLVTSLPGQVFFIGPPEALAVGAGGIIGNQNLPFVVTFDRFGELLTNEWYGVGQVGQQACITEILGP